MTGMVMATKVCGGGGGGGGGFCRGEFRRKEEEQQQQMSIVDLLLTFLRKTLAYCSLNRRNEDVEVDESGMEIGWPTNVRHVTHVTFDRFQGFLGLPVEFEEDVAPKAPSASANVFGVSAKSMQCSYDPKGYSVPTILLLMQERLYSQGGLKAEGIFRINPENSQENHVRDQLNRGIVPKDIDVHCLAGLIKAWFRELPSGVLDGLSPEQVLNCTSEEESVKLLKQLEPTESALLSWAIDLMADVVEEEEFNKMNARNIAMVFAPNMTQMSNPLTALMHAVQVMNFLKTLILKKLEQREQVTTRGYSPLLSQCSGQDSEREVNMLQELNSSVELRRLATSSDYGGYCQHSESEDDAEMISPRDAEDDFLRQLNETGKMTIGTVLEEEPVGFTKRGHVNPQSCYGFLGDLEISLPERTTASRSSILNDKDPVAGLINARRKESPHLLKDGESPADLQMIDRFSGSRGIQNQPS
uniref:Uncharacterized protein n=1 Tax=Kalanchoe fedtschenkoi TaxID=63787 RepID=A0A7N0T8W9_KALFE